MKSLTPWLRKPQTPTVRKEETLPLFTLQQEINHLFGDFMKDFDLSWGTNEALNEYFPRIDMHEEEKELKVTVELPGVDEKDVNVTLTSDSLTVSGEKKSEKKEEAKGYYRMERTYGSFRRTVDLPVEIDYAKAAAKFNNGILEISMPKLAEAQAKSKVIPITKA